MNWTLLRRSVWLMLLIPYGQKSTCAVKNDTFHCTGLWNIQSVQVLLSGMNKCVTFAVEREWFTALRRAAPEIDVTSLSASIKCYLCWHQGLPLLMLVHGPNQQIVMLNPGPPGPQCCEIDVTSLAASMQMMLVLTWGPCNIQLYS